MPSVESSVVTKPPTMYTTTVLKGMSKAEMILKVLIFFLNIKFIFFCLDCNY